MAATDDVNSPTLLPHETEWVKDIVAALKGAGFQFDMLETVQLALVCKGRTKPALERAKKMKSWEEDAKALGMSFQEAYEYACRKDVNQELQVFGEDKEKRDAFCIDYGTFQPDLYKQDEKKWQALTQVMIETYRGATCTLPRIRGGYLFAANSKEFAFRNFDNTLEKKMAAIYQDGYPIKITHVLVVDPPLFIRMVMRIVSLFLKKKLRDRIDFFKLDSGKLLTYFDESQIPPMFGGNNKVDIYAWLENRLTIRSQTEQMLAKEYGENFSSL
eukprot:m.50453 g.50453  ORF g.50453 m.50453 type:complete len:273 (+) comp10671_c0_seq1:203-1021(+)